MPIDVSQVLGAALAETRAEWTPDDVILYQLGLGAGVPATAPEELAYTYEDGLKVLPSFAVIPSLPSVVSAFELPGFDIDRAQVLHGEQDLTVHDVLPPAAEVLTTGRVADIFDKGTGALVVSETITRAADDGRSLFSIRHSVFVRGEGGNGSRGKSAPEAPPDRSPDRVVTVPTLPQQALLYRLSGDKNPIHADPGYAAQGGFPQPIMHGLCTFGMVCKAVVDALLGGDVTAVARYRVRFSGVLFPGETLEISMWEEPGRVAVSARAVERNAPVLSNAAITLREPSGRTVDESGTNSAVQPC